jgi:hypothetical protein
MGLERRPWISVEMTLQLDMRNTIPKYLRSGAVEPEFNVPERHSTLDPFGAKLPAG